MDTGSLLQPGQRLEGSETAEELVGALEVPERPLMSSGYADIYCGFWTNPQGERVQVAVKELRTLTPKNRRTEEEALKTKTNTRLKREVFVWSRTKHPNLHPFLGYCSEPKPRLISPWCRHGNLEDYLHAHPDLTRCDKLRFIYQTACGLEHLHSRAPPICHADIKPENILINDYHRATLSDFGLSRVVQDLEASGYTTSETIKGTLKYMARELSEGKKPNLASDVYAFGGLILTVMSGKPPFDGLHHLVILRRVMKDQPPIQEDHPELPPEDPLWKLMRRSWNYDPLARPTIADVLLELSGQINNDESNSRSRPELASVTDDGANEYCNTDLDIPGAPKHGEDLPLINANPTLAGYLLSGVPPPPMHPEPYPIPTPDTYDNYGNRPPSSRGVASEPGLPASIPKEIQRHSVYSDDLEVRPFLTDDEDETNLHHKSQQRRTAEPAPTDVQDPNADDQQEPQTFFVRALYDYQSPDASFLSFCCGDLIEVLSRLPSGWWDGLLGEQRGWFPSTYVQIVSNQRTGAKLAAREAEVAANTANTPGGPTSPTAPQHNAVVEQPNGRSWPEERTQLEKRTSNVRADDYWIPSVTASGQVYFTNMRTGEQSSELPQSDPPARSAEFPASPPIRTSHSAQHVTQQDTQPPPPLVRSWSDTYATTATGTSTSALTASTGIPKEEEVPAPWVKRTLNAGAYFYMNRETGLVRWSAPSPVLGPRSDTGRLPPLMDTDESDWSADDTYPSNRGLASEFGLPASIPKEMQRLRVYLAGPRHHGAGDFLPSADEIAVVKAPARAAKIAQIFGKEVPAHYVATQISQQQPWFLQPDIDERSILVNANGGVRGGTLPALVERLTLHSYRDAVYNDTFLITFKSFTTVDELFDLLVIRFNIPEPAGLKLDEQKQWVEKKQTPIRIRVINILKMLMEGSVLEKEDMHILGRIREFASEAAKVAPPAQQLIALVNRAKNGEFGRVTKVTTMSQPPPAILPESSRALKLMDVDPLEMARQLTIKESRMFVRIRPMECLSRAKEGRGDDDNIRKIINMSNEIASWVAEQVLSKDDPRRRGAYIKQFIMIAERCREMNNFSSMAALLAGLNSPPIRRLKRSWETLDPRVTSQLDDVEQILDSGRNFKGYRQLQATIAPPCIPFLGVYLTTLAFIQDTNSDMLGRENNLINFGKRQKAAEVIREIKTYQSRPYNLTELPDVQDLIEKSLARVENSPDFWELSMQLEPREREDEKMARLLQESGFL